MPVTTRWVDTDHTIICVEFVDPWMWDEYAANRQTGLHAMLDDVSHPVHFIYDLTCAQTVPPNSLSHIRLHSSGYHRNFSGVVVFVGAHGFLRRVIEMASKLYLTRAFGFSVHYADTIPTATVLLSKIERTFVSERRTRR